MELDYRYIRQVRFLRNLTLKEFETYIQVDSSTVAKLERNELAFSPYYQSKFKEALQRLNIKMVELESVRRIIELKELTGY